MSDSYICSCCGLEHFGVPTSFAADYPDNYANMNADEREARAIVSSDQCVIDGREFFIRGCLEVPIHEHSEPFVWGVWASLWEQDFDDISDHWEAEGRENASGPYKARLANSLSIYPETANLILSIRVRPAGVRPLFLVEDTEHPLAQEQAEGISLETTKRYSCLLMRMS